MEKLFKNISIEPKGIKYKLYVAFALMSIVPMFVCGYLIANYIFPSAEIFWGIYLAFILTVLLMVSGFHLAKRIIYPIVEISSHAKEIAEGKLEERLNIKAEDEIGELSGSLNKVSLKLKANMRQSHSYGEKIKRINREINRKVFALSSLFQIGNLITTGCNLDEVFYLIVEKLSQLEADGLAALWLVEKDSGALTMRAQKNIADQQIRQHKIKIGQGLLGSVVTAAKALVIDSQRQAQSFDQDFLKTLRVKNIIALPVASNGKVAGVLITGNNTANFLFSDDEIELIGVFAKQVAVAIENDTLLRKTEELNVKDKLTDLYNESFIHSRLDEEIKRAVSCQRPCSFVIFEVDNFSQYREILGEIAAEKTIKQVAKVLKESTTEIDKVARFSDHQFAMILPEKNKSQSLYLSENIRKEIERLLSQERPRPSILLALNGGISSTPIDGTTSVELINRALSLIEKAKGDVANKIVIS